MVFGELKLHISKLISKTIQEGIHSAVKKKYLELHEPSFDKDDINSVAKCIKSSFVSSFGENISKFEKKISEITKSKYVVCTNSGTSALHLSLITSGVKSNEEVLIPSLTFVATANSICYLSAIPHFVDIEQSNLGIDPKKLDDYLKKNTQRKDNRLININTGKVISALMPVHLFGHSSKIIDLKNIAKKYDLILIEDAAEALGSFYNRKHLGTFSQVSALSFNGNKIITTGGGGALITNNKSIAKKARYLATTAKKKHPFKFLHTEIGYNYRMPNINAALGCSQINKLNKYLISKRKLANKYYEVFKENEFFDFYLEPKNSQSNYWFQTIILKKRYQKYKNSILNNLNMNGIKCRPAWNTLHLLKPFKNCPKMNLDTTSDLYSRIINIPSSPNLL